MKSKRILSSLIAFSMLPAIAVPTAFAAGSVRYDFNDVTKKTEGYFALNMNTNNSTGGMTYEQATFDGAQVLKSTMNAAIACEAYTWDSVPDMDKVVIRARIGIDGAGNDTANLPRHFGIRPIFNKEDGSKGWGSGGENLAEGIRIEQSRYWRVEGKNPSRNANADTKLGYAINNGELYDVGYVYDRTNKIFKAYVITNNGETYVYDNSSYKHVQSQRYLGGVTLYSRADTTYKTGKGYYDYLYIDEAEAFKADSTVPSNNATGVAVDDNLKVEFNYVIDPSNIGTATVKASDGTTVPVSVSATNGDTLVIDPSTDLVANTSYTLTVTGAKDLLGQSAGDVVVNFKTENNLASLRYDFNDVTTTKEKYFPSLNINTNASAGNMTYEQATFDGAKVLKASMNASIATETHTWENFPNADKVVIQARMGIDGAGNDTANLPRHMGIRPIFNKADGSKGWDSSGSNLGSGIRIEQSRYWNIEGWNPHQGAGGDLNKDGVADTQLGYRIENGKLYDVGYVYDRVNKIFKAYVITNNGETVVKDNSSFNYVQAQRYLGGVTIYTRSDTTYKTGKAYYDYLYIDEADVFTAESTLPSANATDVAVNADFKVNFNYVIDPSNAGTATFKAADGTTVSATVSTTNGKTLVIKPAQELKGNTSYTLTVSGVKDLLGQTADDVTVNFKTVNTRASVRYDFNNVTTITGKYFPSLNISTGSSDGNMTYEQATFDGQQVLKSTMNSTKDVEVRTWEDLPTMDKVVVQAAIGYDAAGNGAANLPYQFGIRPNFAEANGTMGGTARNNLTEGIRMEQSRYWNIEGWNPNQAQGGDTQLGYKIEDGKLYNVGYVYDRVNKIFKAYVITNKGETIVNDKSSNTYVQAQRYLAGVSLYSRARALTGTSWYTGKGYYDYLYIDEAEAFTAESTLPSDKATAVAPDGEIKINFNYVIDPSKTGTVTLKAADGTTAEVEVSTTNGKTLVIDPKDMLKGETTYTLTVSGTKDLLGQSAETTTVRFTTKAVEPTETVKYNYNFDSITATTDIGGNCNPVTNDDVNGEQRGVGTYMSVADEIAAGGSGKSIKLDGSLSDEADSFLKNQQTYSGKGYEYIELSADYYFADLGTAHYMKVPEVKMATADGKGSWDVCEIKVNFDGTLADENKVLTGKKIEEGKWYTVRVRIDSVNDTVTYYVNNEMVVSGNYSGKIDITGLGTIQLVQPREFNGTVYVDNWKLSTWNIFDEIKATESLESINLVVDDAIYVENEDGTVSTIARMATMEDSKTVTVYTAVYEKNVLKAIKLDTVELKKGVVDWAEVPGVPVAEGNTVKTFWFENMKPIRAFDTK